MVALHGSRASKPLAEMREELGDCVAGCYDVSLGGRVGAEELMRRVLADGPIQALVNNAGVYQPLSFAESSDSEFSTCFDEVFRVNWEAPLWLARRACQHFLAQGEGKIVNIASRVGHRGEAGAAAYSASKAALINLTRALAVEHAKKNIRHFALAPGWVDTSMARDGMEDRLPDILETIPLGRMASPEDCAGATAYLLSGEADYLSGIVIDINGASYLR
jgi:3-oxoacyl-[acyl-carrier protein] reductase